MVFIMRVYASEAPRADEWTDEVAARSLQAAGGLSRCAVVGPAALAGLRGQ